MSLVTTTLGVIDVQSVSVRVVQCSRCPAQLDLGSGDALRVAEEALCADWLYLDKSGETLCPACGEEGAKT